MASESQTKRIDPGTPFYKKRYFTFAVITAVVLVLPWIRIDGNHIFLLSFDHMRLELMGVAFDMQELYLMPFLLMFAFLFVLFITTVGGRVWCGWGCPQTIFRAIYRDLIEGKLLGMRRRTNKQKEPDLSKPGNKLKRALSVTIWSVLAFVAAANLTWFFVPPEDFFVYIQNPADHPILMGMWFILAFFLIYDVLKLGEDFCTYVCPYVRVQSAMYDQDTVFTIYDEKRGGKIYDEKGNKIGKKPLGENDECTGCEACVTVCPTHIDIRKGLQLECINCLECADACNKVMAGLGKESLVRWESPTSVTGESKIKLVRFRTVAYVVMLTGIMVALFVMGSTKESMLLNINKSNRVYKVEPIGDIARVSNDYIFLFSNTQSEEYEFYFEVTNNDDVKIDRPSEPFRVGPGERVRKIVVLYTDEDLSGGVDQDVRLHLNIRAYAVDNPEVFVEREAIFVYPPKAELP
jgi:cytochrome c oxidase accessory protein FixG